MRYTLLILLVSATALSEGNAPCFSFGCMNSDNGVQMQEIQPEPMPTVQDYSNRGQVCMFQTDCTPGQRCIKRNSYEMSGVCL